MKFTESGRDNTFTGHAEAAAHVAAQPQVLFDRLDDQTKLGEHMGRSSMMMGGGRMTYEFDEAHGKAVGAHIKFGGDAFGISIFVDEVVTERVPPFRKVWRTVGMPRLIVIGNYKMGFDLAPSNGGTDLSVWIDYELPSGGVGRWLGALPAKFYARWCVRKMANDAKRHFSEPIAGPATV
jgi:hypothetical protein